MTGVLLVDDHWVVHEGISHTLRNVLDITLVGSARTLSEACRTIAETGDAIDVILLDAVLDNESGIDAIASLKRACPRARLLVVSMLAENPHAVRAIEQGADGFVSKGGSSRELVEAIRTVAAGRRFVTPAVAGLLADRLGRKSDLSPRETEIVRYYAQGHRSGQIARIMSLSPKTVSAHKTNAMRKLGVSSNADLIRWAIEHSLG